MIRMSSGKAVPDLGGIGDTDELAALDAVLEAEERGDGHDAEFRRKLGRSVGKEIIRQKVALARKLLEETEKPIKEITSETGFCNIAYFVNTFRRETGLTPRRYRFTPS